MPHPRQTWLCNKMFVTTAQGLRITFFMSEDIREESTTNIVDAHEDVDLNTLLESIEKSLLDGNPDSIRRAYDHALVQHPKNPILWLSYAQYESRLHNYSELEAIFGRHLRQSLDVAFWTLYLRHVRWIAATESLRMTKVWSRHTSWQSTKWD